MIKQIILILAALVAALVLALFAGVFYYTSTDYKTFAILASDPTPAEVKQRLGEPHEIIPAGQDLTQRGWPLPRVKRNATGEIWIYASRTGRNFYVTIDREKDCIAYVFSSSS